MRILGAVFFLLAGKLKKFKHVNKKEFFLKNLAHAYYKRPYFFLSLLAGKLKHFDKGYHESKSRHNFAKTILILHTAKYLF